MGYHRAGFDVVGVDIEPQPRFPFEFHQGDALDEDFIRSLGPFDAQHASPPCQDHMRSPMRGQTEHGTGWMLAAARAQLEASGVPWVIENVPGAPMRPDLVFCGCMFGLEVERVRWFETSWHAFEILPACYHPVPMVNTMRTAHGPWFREHGRIPTRDEVATAMGIDWMRGEEIKQAIPPAYTEHVGRILLSQLRERVA